tara:strand:- start:40 stop:1212 length:1173 start_codon:yes stop_codon:yes gene_type:complete
MLFASFQTYKNNNKKTAFKVVTPYIDRNGKKKQRVSKFDPEKSTMNKIEAKQKAMALAVYINKIGPQTYYDDMTLSEAIEKIYKPERKEQHVTSEPGPLTKKEMLSCFTRCDKHIAATSLYHIPLQNLTAQHCKILIRELKELNNSEDQIRRILITLKHVIDVCVQSEHCVLETNLLRGYRRKNKKNNNNIAVEIPSKKDIDLIISTASPLYSLMFLFISLTGMRWQEMAAFMWDKISWNRDELIIDCSISENMLVYKNKTTSGTRAIPLVKKLKDELIKWKNNPLSDDKFVFGNGKRHWISYNATNNYYKKLKEDCNLDWNGGIHSFRHYYASLLFDWHRKQAISLKDVTNYIGHTDVSFTMKKYAKCFNDDDKLFEQIDRINSCLEVY